MNLKYKRVLLKLSGESLMGEQGFGIDNNVLEFFSEEIQKAYKEAITQFIHTIKKECLNANIEYNLIETSTPFDKALFSYIQKRSRLH